MDVTAVEEDWELVLGQPDADQNAPQVTTVISPLGHLDAWHGVFDINLFSFADYSPGGVQFQIWYGKTPLDCRSTGHGAALRTTGETIRWTQRMEAHGDSVTFQITNGSSSTWGSFGDGDSLKLVRNCELANLNAYNPTVSIENSGISFGGNRVASLTLKTVRFFSQQGLIQEVNLSQVVHTAN